VPERIITKPKIGFFHGAIGAWFSAQVENALGEYLANDRRRTADFLDQDELDRLLHAHRTRPDTGVSRLLLAILLLEIWLTEFVPQAVAAPA
jgi:hypothetical protein